jgi:hypothetical protein
MYHRNAKLILGPFSLNTEPQTVLSRKRLQELLQEIDPRATLDDDVEDVCLSFRNFLSRNLRTSLENKDDGYL